MCDDDDWDNADNAATPVAQRAGVVAEGGCKFSSGRGFVPVERNDGWGGGKTMDSWGDGDDRKGGRSNGRHDNQDDGWGDAAPPSNSWGDDDSGGRRGGRGGGRGGGGRGGFGRGGRGGSRGGGRNFDGDGDRRGGFDDDGDGGGRRGGRRGGFDGDGDGGRRGGRGGGFENGGGRRGEQGGDGGEEPEKKREFYVPPELQNEEDLFTSGITTGVNFMKLDQVHVEVTGNDPPAPIESFETSGLRPHLLDNVKKSGYSKPTAIQKYSIPVILAGRDLMSCAQTGSGKTAAFMLPIIHNLLTNKNPPNTENNSAQPNVVIMSPTRELAIQIGEQGKKFAYNSTVKVAVAYGGTSTNHQRGKILGGCHILVATPGRLKDFVNRGYVSFSSIQYFVLDEADRMLDMGFLGDVEEMLGHASMPATGERQTLMFSATFPEEIQQLAIKFLHNYIFLAVGIVGSACTDVEQKFFKVVKYDKRDRLLAILKEYPDERTLIFVETKRNADFLASFLSEKNMQSTSIHGDRYQSEREQALQDFKSGNRKILVATGVAARGLDIKGVQHVINYDLPNSIDEYVHRIGRTGRVGNYGRATSFFDESQDGRIAGALAKILEQAKQEIPDWLGSQGFGGQVDQFGGRDIRGDNFGRAQDVGAVGAVDEEEVW